LNESQCIENCPLTTVGIEKECVICSKDKSCLECDSSNMNCTKCNWDQAFFLHTDHTCRKQNDDCPKGTYKTTAEEGESYSQNTLCLDCGDKCGHCLTDGDDQCKSCQSADLYFYIKDIENSTGICLEGESCIEGTFENSGLNGEHICYNCNANCKICSNNSTCDQCAEGYEPNPENKNECRLDVPSGFYVHSYDPVEFKPCTEGCNVCINGEIDQCTSCDHENSYL
jgi:hypothetical protein